ncbi:sulfurtransferase [Streptomyces sp. NBC_00053]|uniref:sulfurtransferase n=1 Tax=unclassified Streptomyces TaxID=2593676 RepID=UPI000F5C172A|nr:MULTISPECIES: sulfurtransferase [unclassified Streptomyces]WSX04523.1 sulfurtransferase [Streptomyces sp. NBC_00987]MCX4393386.1 sulfurtransferase [Streptomyces sp. NBC_01767]MCX5163516.1 sulfurtransferase [Streptomyces sp. NBC_00305]MCX5222040.1 sulfurtransferase [Streptomyces sp. NBC_00264]MCX5503738.1 sulfurtransferase [Streptomyces sp. NBC_00052]
MKPIITASEYVSESAGPRPPVLLDVRWQLGGPNGRPEYEAGHIPGAVFVDLDAELAGPAGRGGRHPLPDPDEFGAVMRRAGVSRDTPVVVYDGGQGWAAARAWWLLRWTGHPDVRVLDGGLAAWTGDLDTGIPAPAEGDFRPVPGALPLLDADGAAALARSGLLLDARAAERYRGDVEPIDRVGGHIPGAVSAPTSENTGDDGRFLAPQALAVRFKELGADRADAVGVYCGSGVSGAHEVLALAVAGIPAALYAGSWSEWSGDESRPVATGPEPQ